MTIDCERRRALKLLGGGAAAGLALSACGRGAGGSGTGAGTAESASATAAAKPGPEDFLWGVAGSAYQTEGGNYASDLWLMEHLQPTIFKEPSGDAADTYNRVFEDIALAASLGLNTYRFSLEWSRIEPEAGEVSLAALAYYRRVLEEIHRQGMLPFVTYMHFTTPRWFAAGGGFESREGIEHFVRYCDLVTEHLGDLIGLAATFNEPNLNALFSWMPLADKYRPFIAASRKAAAAASGSAQWAPPMLCNFRVQQPIMVEAHNRAYHKIRERSGGRFPVGVTLALNDERPQGADSGIERKEREVVLPWLEAEGDFTGVQNYTYARVGAEADLPPEPGVELTQMGYPFAPEALANVIRRVAGYNPRPIYVTENGVATEDDSRRIAFIDRAVSGVRDCINEGIDVRGYIHWSLLDNWEWTHGYGPKFGLVSVDRKTFARTPKPSAKHFGRVVRAGLDTGNPTS